MRRLVAVVLAALAAAPAAQAMRPYLGVKGDAARFERQTGQVSVVRHALLGWEQGFRWGTRFRSLLPELAPVPMLHLGTANQANREAITPRGIAEGRGDAYLAALNQAVAEWGRLIYVRPYAEMNGYWNLYSAFNRNGSARPEHHSTAWFRKAFARTYVILHGGPRAQVNAQLARLDLPPVAHDLATNPATRLRVIWNPQGYGSPDIPANSAQAYYPGDAYVDVVGNDLYNRDSKAEWDAAERLYAAHPTKPYAFPEWGLWGVDDPRFVERMCDFVRTHQRVELVAYFEAVPGSIFDLARKPRSAAAYKTCLTPLGRPAPAGSAGPLRPRTTPTPANLLSLAASPAEGAAPLAVTFALESNVPRAQRWVLVFGDGTQTEGTGEPPASVDHTYARDGVYQATLIVYQAPPFVPTAIRFLTQATVTVGEDAPVVLALKPNRPTGKAPHATSFRAVANLGRPITRWEFLPGDGSTRSGTGAPPRFLGVTYQKPGAYRAILVVYLPAPNGVAWLATYADVRVT